MGCDIHMYAEIKKNEKWEHSGKVFKNEYYDPEKESKIDEDGYEWNAEFVNECYQGRNYDLFAILADVRNGRGFAGIYTGTGFNPISDPKGVPVDASDFYLKKVNDWYGDGHSHSYFTLEEILKFDWNQTTLHYGETESITYKECCSYFFNTTIKHLQLLGNPNEVRIVFFFDN